MVGFGEASFVLFIAHIHAPEYYFGLLGGIPWLVGPLTQVVGANWLDRSKGRKRIVTRCVLFQALLFIPFTLLTLGTSNELLLSLFLPLALLYFIASNFGGPAWNSLISELCPSAQRAHYFAKNARNCSVMMLIAKLVLLSATYFATTPVVEISYARMSLVFMGMFAVAGIVRYLSFRGVRRMYEPPYAPTEEATFTFWQFVRRAPQSNFVKFAGFVSVFFFGAFISVPFYAPHVLNVLHREAWAWVVIDVSSATTAVLTFIYWGKFSTRFGNKVTISVTSLLLSAVPALWIMSDSLLWLCAVQCLAGGLWAGFNLSCTNYVMEACSPMKRARCFAYFTIFVGIGCFLGSMTGTAMAHFMPEKFTLFGVAVAVRSTLTYTFLASIVLRFIPGMFMVRLFRELRAEVKPFTVRDWALEIVGARFPLGLIFGAIGTKAHNDLDAPPVLPQVKQPEAERATSESGRLG